MGHLDLGSLFAPNVRERAAEGVSRDDPATVRLPAPQWASSSRRPALGRVWAGDLPEGKVIQESGGRCSLIATN